MKNQDINLLTGSPARASAQPTARQAGAALLALVAVGVAGTFWQGTRASALEGAARTLNASIDNVVANLEERSYSLAERNADATLVAELKRREREAEDKSRVLDLLSGESVGNTAGFSSQLAALGRRHPEGLWLENLRITAGGQQIMLDGQVLHANLVPEFLVALRNEPALAGTPFASLALTGNESGSGPLRFVLATGCAAPVGESAELEAELCVPAAEPADEAFARTETSLP